MISGWSRPPYPSPGANQMLTRTIYLSLDPYQWGRRRNGLEAAGEVCHGRTVSQVVESNLPGYRDGDFVFNTNGWQAYGLTGEGISVFTYMFPRKIEPVLAPISTAVGVLGMLGLTAYAGMVRPVCAQGRGDSRGIRGFRRCRPDRPARSPGCAAAALWESPALRTSATS